MDREKALKIVISGRVQGVGFRYFTKQKAAELGLEGWVRNLSNGDVESVIRGTEHHLETMISELQRGPSAARVENIEMSEIGDIEMEEIKKLKEFSIAR